MDNVDGQNKLIIEELFERALERIDAGEPVDAILNSCPEELYEELLVLLPVSGGLKDIAYSSIPLPPVERRQQAKSQFLMAVADERARQVSTPTIAAQQFVPDEYEAIETTQASVVDTGVATPKAQYPTRTLVEPEKPGFLERVSSLFAFPKARLATFAVALLLLLGAGTYVTSTSYVGHWAYPVKQISRDVGLALVPEAARERRELAQSEAIEKDIQRGKDVAVEKNEEVTFSDKATVEKIEKSEDGTILHTSVGDFVVALDEESEILSAPASVKIGDVIEIDALIVPINEAPVKILQVEVVATAAPPPTSTNTPQPTNTLQPTVAPTVIACQPNVDNWRAYIVKPNDTLVALALRGQTTYAVLAQRNCIVNADNLVSGRTIYLPPIAFAQPTPFTVATTAPTLTIAPVLAEQTPTEMPAVSPNALQPDVIATSIPLVPTSVEVDGTVTITITKVSTAIPTAILTTIPTVIPSINTALPTAPTPTATVLLTALPTVASGVSVPLTPTVEIAPTVGVSITEPAPAQPTSVSPPVIITNTVTVTASPSESGSTPEAVVETPTLAPTTVEETSIVTATQAVVPPTPVSATETSLPETSVPETSTPGAEIEPNIPITTPAIETAVAGEIIATVPISATVQPIETAEPPSSELPTAASPLEPTVTPTSTAVPTAQPVFQPPVDPTTDPVVAPTVGTPENFEENNTPAAINTAVGVSTVIVLTPVITPDAEVIIAATATITPVIMIPPTSPAPAMSPVPPAPPPPQATAQTAPIIVTAGVPLPPAPLPVGATATLAVEVTAMPVVTVEVMPEELQPPATVSGDSSDQQIQAAEVQPTTIESVNPIVPTVTIVVDPTEVDPTEVVPTEVVPTEVDPMPTVLTATEVPQSFPTDVPPVVTAVPPTVTAVVIVPTATIIGLDPISPLAP